MIVQIEFLPSKNFTGKSESQVISLILEIVKKGRILVLESALSPGEEKLLIEKTMHSIDKRFSGIEIATLGRESSGIRNRLIELLGGKLSGFTVVGPSNLVREIRRDPNKLSLFAGST